MGFTDLLFGKKKKAFDNQKIGLSPEQAAQNKVRTTNLFRLSDEANAPVDYSGAEQEIKRDLFNREKLTRAAYEDQKRRLGDIVKQRGLGGSSVGLSQELGLSADMANKLAETRSLFPSMLRAEKERLRDKRFNRLRSVIGTAGPLQVARYVQSAPAKRGGGLFGLATTLGGAAAGGIIGGPQGAGIGAQLGSGVGQVGTSMAS